MSLSRRFLLRGLLATTAFTAAAILRVKALFALPELFGDGVTDDTAALNAFFRGEKVLHKGAVLADPLGIRALPPGEYCVSGDVAVRGRATIFNFEFISYGAPFTLDFSSVEAAHVRDVIIHDGKVEGISGPRIRLGL
jgi:hypothetical protein